MADFLRFVRVLVNPSTLKLPKEELRAVVREVARTWGREVRYEETLVGGDGWGLGD